MLAQNFKSADELDISEAQVAALQKTLVMLETGKLRYATPDYKIPDARGFSGQFNMNQWNGGNDCGTIACIGGTAEMIGAVHFGDCMRNTRLQNLFWPHAAVCEWSDITPSQAATALRSYLTTGDARWDLAVA